MKARIWIGRVTTALVALAMIGSAAGKLAGSAKMVEELTHAGIPREAIIPIAMLELTCLTLFLLPRTTLLGLLLVTGYFGGATLTHVVAHQSLAPPLVIGLWAWISAYLRTPQIQELLPVARPVEAR